MRIRTAFAALCLATLAGSAGAADIDTPNDVITDDGVIYYGSVIEPPPGGYTAASWVPYAHSYRNGIMLPTGVILWGGLPGSDHKPWEVWKTIH